MIDCSFSIMSTNILLCNLQPNLGQRLHTLAKLGSIRSTGIAQDVADIDALNQRER